MRKLAIIILLAFSYIMSAQDYEFIYNGITDQLDAVRNSAWADTANDDFNILYVDTIAEQTTGHGIIVINGFTVNDTIYSEQSKTDDLMISDSFSIYMSGDSVRFAADFPIQVNTGIKVADTIYAEQVKTEELEISDTLSIYVSGDTVRYETDQPSKFNSGVLIEDTVSAESYTGSGVVDLDTTKINYRLNITTVNAAAYDINDVNKSGEIYHVTYTNTGTVTITLDSDVAIDGYFFTIKDADGNASGNTITIDTEGAETIDGGATTTITGDYDAVTIYSAGTNFFIK